MSEERFETVVIGKRIDWMTVGKEYNETDEQKTRLKNIFATEEWQEIGSGITVGAMPGLTIKEIIREFKIPKVSHIAISRTMSPLGLYGIRGHYKNGTVNLWVVDSGDVSTPVACEVGEA